jgi:hypothetical protein
MSDLLGSQGVRPPADAIHSASAGSILARSPVNQLSAQDDQSDQRDDRERDDRAGHEPGLQVAHGCPFPFRRITLMMNAPAISAFRIATSTISAHA